MKRVSLVVVMLVLLFPLSTVAGERCERPDIRNTLSGKAVEIEKKSKRSPYKKFLYTEKKTGRTVEVSATQTDEGLKLDYYKYSDSTCYYTEPSKKVRIYLD